MKGLQRKLLRDLKTMQAQILTIAILIICGISVLVSSWSSYQSLERSKESYYKNFHFADIFAELVRAPESVVANLGQLEGIERVESRLIKDGLVNVPNQTEPALGRFISWNEQRQKLNLIYLRQGRLPQASSNIEVLVHESFASAHNLKPGDHLQVLLSGQLKTLVISGIGLSPEYVYALSPVAPLPDDKHFGIFWLRRQDMETITGLNNAFNSVQLKVSDKVITPATVEELKRKIDSILQPYGNIHSYDRSRQISNMFVEDEIRQQRAMAVIMPAIFLSVAMFLLNVILSRLIALHRGAIATLKSLGYGAWVLTFHYFQLVSLILITGLIPSIFVGAGIGKLYAQLYRDFFRFPVIDFSLSPSSVGLGILMGLLAGWLGAANALSQVFFLEPAEALRPPNPPPFQKGLFERLGFTKNLSVFSKIVLRSLLSRPLRTLLNIVGMASAIAILINGSFWTDVIDFMINRQFHEMRRSDLTVRLLHPQDPSVFSELNQLPGILMVEGERNIPVRFQFRNFRDDISVLGWSEDAQLNRVLDKAGKVIRPIQGGVILGRYFEKKYSLRSGDSIKITALEGEQREVTVPIIGFVDDLLGKQAYALKSDLHRWMREKTVVDTLQLKIDPQFSEKIYVALKEKPEVADISSRKLLLKSFSQTIANMILTFTIILYFFAIAIAGAIMYNSARISFSERAWEMASLRILGYGQGMTFELLFIDIGLQLLLALVPGILLGYYLSSLIIKVIHNDTFTFPLVIELSTYGSGVLILIVTFLMSGIFLYQKILQLDFSSALKARE